MTGVNGFVSPRRPARSEPARSEPAGSEPAGPDAGTQPVVRPYAVTSGRTRPAKGSFELTTIIMAKRAASVPDSGHGPEHLAIIRMCCRPRSVAEIVAYLELPHSVVAVLLGDLLRLDLITVGQPQPADALSDETLEALVEGLRSI